MSLDVLIAEIASRQYGLITRAQALALGLTLDGIHHRLRSKRWVTVRSGVYAINGTPSTAEQALLAAVLAAGQGAVASHLTAARLYGFTLPEPFRIDVLTRETRRVRLAGVRHHRTEDLHPDDVVVRRNIPVTSAARTLVDCSGDVFPLDLGSVVDNAMRRGLENLEALRSCHERLATGPGRRPTRAMRMVLDSRPRGYEPGGSDRERRVADVLAEAGLPRPVPQLRVKVGGRSYRLDYCWPDVMVYLEWDGWETHGTYTAFHADRRRTRLLAAAGWTGIPVTAHTTDAEMVRDVASALAVSGHRKGA
jgi:hypothetical protein